MAAGDVVAHRLSIGRHLYPGLVVARFLHDFEDFVSGYYDRFPLFTLSTELFVGLHIGILLLLLAMVPSVAHGRRWALNLARFYAIVEILSGAGHIMISLIESRYYPGLFTAPLLLIFGAALGRSLQVSDQWVSSR